MKTEHNHYRWSSDEALAWYEEQYPGLTFSRQPFFYERREPDEIVVRLKYSSSCVLYLVGRERATIHIDELYAAMAD